MTESKRLRVRTRCESQRICECSYCINLTILKLMRSATNAQHACFTCLPSYVIPFSILGAKGFRFLQIHVRFLCLASSRFSNCEGEVPVIRPHLLGESAQGYLLLDLREDEGQEEVLEDKDEEEKENEVDEKVKEVRENAQLMHATWR